MAAAPDPEPDGEVAAAELAMVVAALLEAAVVEAAALVDEAEVVVEASAVSKIVPQVALALHCFCAVRS